MQKNKNYTPRAHGLVLVLASAAAPRLPRHLVSP
jgi:hypothetical protein